jgi:hypothetical protein
VLEGLRIAGDGEEREGYCEGGVDHRTQAHEFSIPLCDERREDAVFG